MFPIPKRGTLGKHFIFLFRYHTNFDQNWSAKSVSNTHYQAEENKIKMNKSKNPKYFLPQYLSTIWFTNSGIGRGAEETRV